MPRSHQKNTRGFFGPSAHWGYLLDGFSPRGSLEALDRSRITQKMAPSRARQDNRSLRLGLASVVLHAAGAKARAWSRSVVQQRVLRHPGSSGIQTASWCGFNVNGSGFSQSTP
eukprot:4455413-Pyramimonas_sp.AAC.1